MIRRTRLLAVSWTPVATPDGGAAIRGGSLSRRLAAHFDLRLLAPGGPPAGIGGGELPRPRRLPLAINSDLLGPLFRGWRRALAREVERFEPDVVVAFGLWSLLGAWAVLRRRAGRTAPRLVFDAGHVEWVAVAERRGRLHPAALAIRLAERRALSIAEEIWCVSEEDRRRLETVHPPAAGATIVPNSFDPLPPTGRIGDGTFRALFLARLSWGPNRDAARFLAREVAPRCEGAELVVAGRGAPRGLAGQRLRVIDGPEDLDALYASVDAVMAPLFSGTGSRIKLFEAAMRGKPIVASPRAAEGLGLLPGEEFLPARSGAEFAAALEALRRDPEKGAGIARQARARVLASGGWEASAQAAARSLERLLRNAKAPSAQDSNDERSAALPPASHRPEEATT